MNKTTLTLLSLVTIIILIAAIQIQQNNHKATPAMAEAALFPKLNTQLQQISSIQIDSPEGQFKISKKENKWGLDNQQSYPVTTDKVAQILNGLVSLNRVATKTKKADLHHKLHLQARSVSDAQSTQIILQNDQGIDIANILLGKTQVSKADNSLQAFYVRFPEQDQTWLAHTPMRIEKNADNWLDKTIMSIAKKRMQTVTVIAKNATIVRINKLIPAQKTYQLENLPTGAIVEQTDQLDRIANVLGNLTLNDVKKITDIEKPKTYNKAIFNTFDGLQINMDIIKIEEKYWVSFGVQTDPTANTSSTNDAKIDIIKQAADISATTQGWIYQVPTYKMKNLLKPHSELFTMTNAVANTTSSANQDSVNTLIQAFANANSQKPNQQQQDKALDIIKRLGQQ